VFSKPCLTDGLTTTQHNSNKTQNIIRQGKNVNEDTFNALAQRMDTVFYDIEHDESSRPSAAAGADSQQVLPIADDPQKPNDVIMQLMLYEFCVVLLVHVRLCL